MAIRLSVGTVKKAIINVIEQFRILRVYDTSVGSCVGYVFPRNLEMLCMTKVRVTFHNFMFTYTLQHLCKGEVKLDITAAIRKWRQSHLISSIAPPTPTLFIFHKKSLRVVVSKWSLKPVSSFETTAVQDTGSSTQTLRRLWCISYGSSTKLQSCKVFTTKVWGPSIQ